MIDPKKIPFDCLSSDEERQEWLRRAYPTQTYVKHVVCPDCCARLDIVSENELPSDTRIEFVEHVD